MQYRAGAQLTTQNVYTKMAMGYITFISGASSHSQFATLLTTYPKGYDDFLGRKCDSHKIFLFDWRWKTFALRFCRFGYGHGGSAQDG